MTRDDRHRNRPEPTPEPGAEPDEQLGAALRAVPVPDHQPRFWAELAQRLAGEPARSPAAPAAGLRPEENENVISLDERHGRRRRFRLPAGAAAALVVILAVAGVLWARGDNGRRVEVADRPSAGTATPVMVTATYDRDVKEPGLHRLTAAADGSYRWTSGDGNRDSAYDAAQRTAVEVVQGADAYGQPYGFVYTDLAPGGPDQGILAPEPIGNLTRFVSALGRSGDPRVEETSVLGRPAWRYDGPLVADRLGGEGVADHAVVDVDRATGVLLSVQESSAGRPKWSMAATSFEVSERLDRSRFQLEVPPAVKKTVVSRGFRAVSLDEARDLAGYDPLVPAEVPDGFRLETVAVDPDVPSTNGAEGMNPQATHIVAVRYSDGFSAFTVSQRPEGNPEYPWDDPFGQEGMSFQAEPVKLRLPGGRPAVEGMLVFDPPSVPHLWGITGELVVTVDGDLAPAELRRVAGSLQAHR